jgi:hypothetical protein
VGIVATAFMLSNFLYSVRKRLRAFTGWGSIRRWLSFHTFVGFMSPAVIAFHAAFQSNNHLATATAASLAVVMLTGVLGRYLYAYVPSEEGKLLELDELTGRWSGLKGRLTPMIARTGGAADAVRWVLARATLPPARGSLLSTLVIAPFQALKVRWMLGRVKGQFSSSERFDEFRAAFLRLERLRVQIGFYGSLKRLMSSWRIFHVILAILLVVMIAAHIAVSLFLGYRWIFV